jgi:predicted nuclease with TOPRIM domain
MFEDMIKNIDLASRELKELQVEAENLSKGGEGVKSEVRDKKSKLEPMTKLRNNVEEINQERKNPELFKIKDRLGSIIEGIFK